MNKPGNILKAAKGEDIGTVVRNGANAWMNKQIWYYLKLKKKWKRV
jgi:hypothetical protein